MTHCTSAVLGCGAEERHRADPTRAPVEAELESAFDLARPTRIQLALVDSSMTPHYAEDAFVMPPEALDPRQAIVAIRDGLTWAIGGQLERLRSEVQARPDPDVWHRVAVLLANDALDDAERMLARAECNDDVRWFLAMLALRRSDARAALDQLEGIDPMRNQLGRSLRAADVVAVASVAFRTSACSTARARPGYG